jgi:hypothetical protein
MQTVLTKDKTPVPSTMKPVLFDLEAFNLDTIKIRGDEVTNTKSSDTISDDDDDDYDSSYDSDFTYDDESSYSGETVKTNKTVACERECSSELMTASQIQAMLARQRHQHNHGNDDVVSQLHADTIKSMLNRSNSEPNLHHMVKKPLHIQQQTMETLCDEEEEDDEEPMNPNEKVLSILSELGVNAHMVDFNDLLKLVMYEPFCPSKHSYDSDIVTAVRQKDMASIKAAHAAGKDVNCRNPFGESVVHMSCRKGSRDILYFLLHKAGASVRICCDSGRNPLHDACWTAKPSFDCVKIVLHQCPDLLLSKDKRGFTPLDYVPRDCWRAWNMFFDEHQELLLPKVLFQKE